MNKLSKKHANYLKQNVQVCCFIGKKNQKALMVSIGNVNVVRKIARILCTKPLTLKARLTILSFMNDKHVSNTLGRTFLLESANTYVKRKAKKTVIGKLHYYINKETGKNCTTNKKKASPRVEPRPSARKVDC